MRRTLVVVVGLVLCLAEAAAAGDDQAYKRWAILSSQELQESGLADLLTVEAQRIEGVALLERDELQAIGDELALVRVLGSENAGSRLKLGQLLRADALVLMAHERSGRQEYIRLVISDCVHGARLRMECLPYSPDGVANLSCRIADMIAETRARFPEGISQIFGVSPFVSRNLVHDYDHLQASFAHLLESALNSLPGVAVIETQEAHAIRHEHELAGEGKMGPLTPLVLEGEFEVTKKDVEVEEDLRLRMTLQIKDGSRVVGTVERRSLSTAEAAGFLRTEIPDLLLSVSDRDSTHVLSVDQQFELLTSRADTFGQLGAWEHALGLREAAILLRSDSLPQRLLVIGEYCRWVSRPFPRDLKRRPGEEEYERQCGQRVAKWHLCLEHIEYLIRNRLVGISQAVGLMQNAIDSLLPVRAFGSEHLRLAECDKKAFLREMYPVVLEWLREAEYPGDECGAWSGFLCRNALRRYEGNFLDKADLDFLLELLEHAVPDGSPRSNKLMYFLSEKRPSVSHQRDHFSEAEYLQFLHALKHSGKRLCVRYADYGLSVMQPKKADVKAAARASLHPDRTAGPSSRKPKKKPESTERLTFIELPLRARQLGGRIQSVAGTQKILNCTDSLDVFWGPGAVLFLRQEGLLEQVLADRELMCDDVKWDGRHVWVATRWKGIWLLSESGERVAAIGPEDGLPPCDRGMMIHPVEPGKVCVIGSFGEHRRAWCAIVKSGEDGSSVNVFHRATLVPGPYDDQQELVGDPAVVFKPQWVHEYHAGGGNNSRLLLVGRYTPTRAGRTRPLEIDLNTLAVSVSRLSLYAADHRYSDSYFSKDGWLLEAGDYNVMHWGGPGKVWEDGNEWVSRCGSRAGGLRKILLFYKGAIYVPGSTWYRLHLDTMEAECLAERLPGKYASLQCLGVSGHYGLVAWGSGGRLYRGRLYRVEVDAAHEEATEALPEAEERRGS